MRQISQGVEEISVENGAAAHAAEGMDVNVEEIEEPAEAQQDAPTERSEHPQEPPRTDAPADPPSSPSSSNMDVQTDKQPQDTQPSAPAPGSPQTSVMDIQTDASPSSHPSPSIPTPALLASRRSSQSEGEGEKAMKRKLADRASSQGPMETDAAPIPMPPKSKVDAAPKRPRDDADTDDNPRVTKRPSPPPPEEKEADAARKPKPSGISKACPTTPPTTTSESSSACTAEAPPSPKAAPPAKPAAAFVSVPSLRVYLWSSSVRSRTHSLLIGWRIPLVRLDGVALRGRPRPEPLRLQEAVHRRRALDQRARQPRPQRRARTVLLLAVRQ
ncbi:hypothetical protein HETIRDRAFT_220464, partial [Heterobasidion irregulare TC 32-1]